MIKRKILMPPLEEPLHPPTKFIPFLRSCTGSNAVNEVFERNKENYDDKKETLKVLPIPSNRKVIVLLYPLHILSLRKTKLDAGSVEQAEATINTILNNVSPDISDIWWDKNSLISDPKDKSKNFAKELNNGKEYFKSAIQEIEQHWNKRGENDEVLAKNIQEESNNEGFALIISTSEEEQAASITNNATSVVGAASSSPGNNDASPPGNKKEDNVDATATSVNVSNTNTQSTASGQTPEKNYTNFCGKHKGKIALGVTGLCAAGAFAAYMLAYPVVALALAVLAAVILMGAGIAKVR
ncbi:unnamed protein product [Parnassius apollo]|uniref:(apollo) hypothetical protein n=1 Tax=Parnassius apollo TaxID=110799 RepID=A0A8S3Y931_PARAO|nr:unnamed protein product [Parnassius apollo]